MKVLESIQHARRHTEKSEHSGTIPNSLNTKKSRLVNEGQTLIFRLFDTPTTPKTIIQKSALNKPADLPNSQCESIFTKKSVPFMQAASVSHDRPTVLHVHNKVLDNVNSAANVNPFSPNSKLACRRLCERCPMHFFVFTQAFLYKIRNELAQ